MTQEQHHSPVKDSIADERTKSRKRKSTNSSEKELRKARKARENWTQRRQYVQSKMLGLTAIVFSILVVVILLSLLAEWEIPYIVEGALIAACLALLVWGVFSGLEQLAVRRYQVLSKRRKSSKDKYRKHSRRRHSSSSINQNQSLTPSDDSLL